MTQYREIKFIIPEKDSEVFIAKLTEFGFDSFWEQEDGLSAYIEKKIYDKNKLVEFLKENNFNYPYSEAELENKNWNQEWENNFEPVECAPLFRIRATFHIPQPDIYRQEIIINPKMAFGTGHHETTRLMSENLFSVAMAGKKVLDCGTGTGVLAILAEKLGAEEVDAYDIDEWSFDNLKENSKLNDCKRIHGSIGTILTASLRHKEYDLILANINRNVLLDEMEHYVNRLKADGLLVLSGFYSEDVPMLTEKATALKLVVKQEKALNNWTMLLMKKK